MQLVLISAIIRNLLLVGTALFTYYILFVLEASPVGLGVTFSVGFFSSAICSLLGGFLGDKLGRKRVVVLGFLISALGWLSFVWVTVVWEALILYGIVMGAMSGLYPAYAALISDIVYGENVGGALGLVNAITSLFGAIGALLAGYVAMKFGYNVLFVIVFVFATASLTPLLILRVDETREKRRSANASTFVNLLLSSKDLLFICSSVFIITLGTFVSLFYPDYVKATFGVGRFEVAVFDSIYFAVWTLSNYPGGILYDRLGKRIVLLGYLLMGVAWLMFPTVNQLYLVYAIYAMFSLGNSLGYFMTALALGAVSPERKSFALGTMDTFMYVGVAMAGLIGGFLWTFLGTFLSFILAFISCMASSVRILFIKAK